MAPNDQPLQSRPEATAFTVRELLARVRAGKVRVPEFQRPLRWGARQNRDLLDSIWRGYPIEERRSIHLARAKGRRSVDHQDPSG